MAKKSLKFKSPEFFFYSRKAEEISRRYGLRHARKSSEFKKVQEACYKRSGFAHDDTHMVAPEIVSNAREEIAASDGNIDLATLTPRSRLDLTVWSLHLTGKSAYQISHNLGPYRVGQASPAKVLRIIQSIRDEAFGLK